MNKKEITCTENSTDHPVIVSQPSVEMDEAVKALLKTETEQCTIVHCRDILIFSNRIRIWPQTVLVEDTGSTRKLLKAFNISLYPEWTWVRNDSPYHHFTLVFEGLGKECRSFYLDERIPEEFGFYTEQITRNFSDVYEAEILVKF